MIEKYPGVMMPPSDELTPEVKKAIDNATASRTIVIDSLPQAEVKDYIKNADIDIAGTYPTPEEIGEHLMKMADDQRFANSKLVVDESMPNVVVNTPSQDVHFGNMSGHTVDWKEFKSETPYIEKPFEGSYPDQVIKAYSAARGPFDFSLEAELKNKELSELAETTHVDIPVLWNPEGVNHNGRAYSGAAQGATMRRILPELKGALKHPDKVVLIEDTEMDMSKALAEAIIHDEVHHQAGFVALDKQGNFIDAEQAIRYGKRLRENLSQDNSDTLRVFIPEDIDKPLNLPKGMGKAYSEEVGEDAQVVHLNFGNPYRPGFNYMVTDTGSDTEKVSVHGVDDKVEIDAELIDGGIDVSLADPDKPKEKVFVLGHSNPRYLGAMLYNAIKDAGIDATVAHSADKINDGIAEPIRNTGSSNMKHISPAALSLKHMQAVSPYASGRKKPRDDFMDERRLEMRNSQSKRNKAQGYGKRITKKDKGVDITKAGLFSGADVKPLPSEIEFEIKMSITPEGVKALSKNQVIDGECTDIKSEDKE